MKLNIRSKVGRLEDGVCELTDLLDTEAKLTKFTVFKHYIMIDDMSLKERCLPIRVPGGTVGGIWIDENNVITKISIDTNYVVKTYPNNINEIVQKFIGQTIELERG